MTRFCLQNFFAPCADPGAGSVLTKHRKGCGTAVLGSQGHWTSLDI